MKALLALNESTTAEIIADILQVDPQQAEAIASQMRLSEILDMIQHVQQNSMGEANEIIKPYLAELLGPSGIGTASSNSTIQANKNRVKGLNKDEETEEETGEPVGPGTATFTNAQGDVEAEVPATTSTRLRMARQGNRNAQTSVRNIG